MYQQRGYLLNQVLYTWLLILTELLSKYGSATLAFLSNDTFLPLPVGEQSSLEQQLVVPLFQTSLLQGLS